MKVFFKHVGRARGGCRILLSALAVILANGCAGCPSKSLQPEIGFPKSIAGVPDGIGIALAGGGTKAASYAMGVLAAVADSEKCFDQVKAISSVSGGGFAAFFLYSKLLLREQDRRSDRPEPKDFFADCIPRIYTKILPEDYEREKDKYQPPLCAASCDSSGDGRFLFQQFVRCRQDVLENDCKQELGKSRFADNMSALFNAFRLLGYTGEAFVPNLVTRTIFDWPFNLSPSRYYYRQGIGTTYGLYPLKASALGETCNLRTTCNDENFLNCENCFGSATMERAGMGFRELRRLTSNYPDRVPIWFINTTASKHRSAIMWSTVARRDFAKYTLTLSPFDASSGFYGMIPDYEKRLDLLEAVTASAAYADSNEIVLDQPFRSGLAMLLHLAVLDWGIDIRNPNVPSTWESVHRVLPVPFYYLDGLLRIAKGADSNQHSVYIRLLDGGNNDNLGAFTLIERGMKRIIISDHAQDNKGKLGDLCRLHNELMLRGIHPSAEQKSGHRHKLLLPGLDRFQDHCKAFLHESECGLQELETAPNTLANGHYEILKWTHPVLLGCVVPEGSISEHCEGEDVEARVYVIKPALNLHEFKKNYLMQVISEDGRIIYKVAPKACSAPEYDVCEVAAYIADYFNAKCSDEDIGEFPQDTTFGMTFASTGKRYGAYRELARWHTRKALGMKECDDKTFAEKVKEQQNHQIRRLSDSCPFP